ncbi:MULTISPECIES: 3'-5' exonuclease [unclassified Polaromonas]|uniref:3'-5' exonuclease n=1 Tax=unclassified Polaromonas TaxID=2638319 RepID=UPI001A227DA4|nr:MULTISPECIES: 3'-5' exonuclease [unclassified Polaromonas]MBG6073920.1 superfamily I DNA/RNA helicase [Polaromonas sp. CG_9.7]MBG6115901.1 superfamily I DNA/RNA helicase [Polaromonas sp. CG_9.2]MDH6183326.1 superfamily I DNA/RNA helicase [Polaromonas sp. CG_23.6]
MATLIPTTGTTSFDTTGKRWLAERLGQRLSDYSLWHTVRVGLKQPVSCGRDGQAPILNKLPTQRDEAFAIADHLASAQKKGFVWGDMVMPYLDWATMDLCASALAQRKLPHRVRKRSGDYNLGADAIQVMTMKVSKGLEFPVVALPGVGHMPAPGEDEKEAARVFYMAATRATQRLVMGGVGDWWVWAYVK